MKFLTGLLPDKSIIAQKKKLYKYIRFCGYCKNGKNILLLLKISVKKEVKMKSDKEKFMKEAIKESMKAYGLLEVPVGAVIVKDNKIIARAYNKKETKNDTTNHAEILAIKKASKKLNSWRLIDCEMYVTLEPCGMCAGALIQSRIKKVYIGAMDEKTGACGSVLNLLEDYKFNHKVEVETGILKNECEETLKKFFKELRKLKKK